MDLTDIAQRRPVVAARERIVSTAYALFTRRGVRAVGIDEIISQSGVAKATMYRHFPTKNDLVLAVLQRREQLWTFDLVERQSRLRGSTPKSSCWPSSTCSTTGSKSMRTSTAARSSMC